MHSHYSAAGHRCALLRRPILLACPGDRKCFYLSDFPLRDPVTVHLRNISGIATACVVKASRQKRVTGLSAEGEAEVTFAALPEYKGDTVRCKVNYRDAKAPHAAHPPVAETGRADAP